MLNKKAQSTLEFCILPALVVAAFLIMWGYLTRAVQRNMRTNTDSFSDEQFDSIYSSEEMPSTNYAPPGVDLAPGTIIFKDPKIEADLYWDGSIDQVFDVGSGSGNKQIGGWGTYHD
jgi:hypothetical protein